MTKPTAGAMRAAKEITRGIESALASIGKSAPTPPEAVIKTAKIIDRETGLPGLLDVSRDVLPMLEECGYGGKNIATATSHVKRLRKAIIKTLNATT